LVSPGKNQSLADSMKIEHERRAVFGTDIMAQQESK